MKTSPKKPILSFCHGRRRGALRALCGFEDALVGLPPPRRRKASGRGDDDSSTGKRRRRPCGEGDELPATSLELVLTGTPPANIRTLWGGSLYAQYEAEVSYLTMHWFQAFTAMKKFFAIALAASLGGGAWYLQKRRPSTPKLPAIPADNSSCRQKRDIDSRWKSWRWPLPSQLELK